MKAHTIKKLLSFSRFLLPLGLLLLIQGGRLSAQEEEQAIVEKKNVRLSLAYFNIDNLEYRLVATVKTKVDRSYENVPGVAVDFYFGIKDPDDKLGTALTDEKGEATLTLPETLKKTLDTLSQATFLAAVENNEEFEDDEDEIEIWKSNIALELEKEDTTKWVRFLVTEPDSLGEWLGVEDVEATIFVQRLFGLLPITEAFEMTDEEGYLEVEFPDDIPGDGNGEVTIVARVDDHERFGNLRVSKSINWGLPAKASQEKLSRELWSSRANAPVYLIVVVNLMILGIWGVIVYIIAQILRIKRMGEVS